MQIDLKKSGNSLVSRTLARSILEKFDLDKEKISLNFEGVETVTPSFSHELISVILEKNISIKEVDFLNANPSVMLQLKKALLSIEREKRSI